MGFHYVGTGRYQLTVSVIGGHGTVTPVSGQYHEFQVVTLVATPDAGYRVKQWIGTDRDPSWNRNTNTVTMDTGASKFVTVEFERSITQQPARAAGFRDDRGRGRGGRPGRDEHHPQPGHAPRDLPERHRFPGQGDRPDVHRPERSGGRGQDDHRRCGATSSVRGRAFHFHSGEDANSVIAGVTIRNGYVRGPRAADGRFGVPTPVPYEVVAPTSGTPPRPRAERGT